MGFINRYNNKLNNVIIPENQIKPIIKRELEKRRLAFKVFEYIDKIVDEHISGGYLRNFEEFSDRIFLKGYKTAQEDDANDLARKSKMGKDGFGS